MHPASKRSRAQHAARHAYTNDVNVCVFAMFGQNHLCDDVSTIAIARTYKAGPILPSSTIVLSSTISSVVAWPPKLIECKISVQLSGRARVEVQL